MSINMLYISRMDYARTIGWWVRRQGLKIQKFFPDLRHGSKKKALSAAVEYRDQLLEDFGPNGDIGKSQPRRRYNYTSQYGANDTGVVGVCEYWSTNKAGETWLVGYMAYYSDHPKQYRKWFSFTHHGNEAFQKAVAWRKKNEKKIRLAIELKRAT